jgi:hypothetical protein
MPMNTAREARARVRELARARMRNLRKRNREERLPSTREIDNALRDGLTIFLATNSLASRKAALGHPAIRPTLEAAFKELQQANFDIVNRKTRVRFWQRLGVFAA